MVIDILNGDPLTLDQFGTVDLPKYIEQGSTGDNPHNPPAIDPIVKAAIKALKEEHGVKKIGAAGYCFGAKVQGRPE